MLPGGLQLLQLQMMTIEADEVIITATTRGRRACCPACNQPSSRMHRYCQRLLADLPGCGRRVHLRVRARHFYCANPACSRKTFSERLTGTAGAYARRTDRLRAALLGLVYEAGGEAGAREARRLGMPVSAEEPLLA